MSAKQLENLWLILREYDFQIDLRRSSELVCVICRALLRDAVTSMCSCRFCKSCISSFLSSGSKMCPGNSFSCRTNMLNMSDNVFFDEIANKMVSNLIGKCPVKSCPYETMLINMADHLQSCGTTRIDESPQLDETVPMSVKEVEQNGRDSSKMGDVALLEDLLVKENGELRIEIALLKQQFEKDQGRIESLESHMSSMYALLDQILSEQKALTNQMDTSLQSREFPIKSQCKPKIQNEIIRKSLENIEIYPGKIFWKLTNFSQIKSELSNGPCRWLDGPVFQTCPTGYEMQLRLWISDSAIEILVKMVPESKNRSLHWPVTCEVTVGIIHLDTEEYLLPKETKSISYKSVTYASSSMFRLQFGAIKSSIMKTNSVAIKCFIKDDHK